MKKLFIIISVTVLSVLGFISCNKDIDEKESNSVKVFFSQGINPLDSEGEFHNNSLNFIAESHDDIANISSNEFFALLFEYQLQLDENFTFPITSSELATLTDSIAVLLEGTSLSSLINQAYYSTDISEPTYDVLITMNNNIIDNGDDLEDFMSDINDLENIVSQTSGLNDIEEELLWMCLSVAKYSCLYWHNSVTDVNHPYYQINQAKDKPSVICEDVKGAWDGFWNPVGNTPRLLSAKNRANVRSHQAKIVQ